MDRGRDKHPKKGDHGEPSFKVVDRRPGHEAASGPAPEGPTPQKGPLTSEGDRAPVQDDAARRAEDAERRLKEVSAAYVRLEQDREAFRVRLSRDLDRRVDIARADFLRKVIDVLDDLDRALAAARTGAAGEALLRGVELTRDRLMQALVSEGVEPSETLGRPFDPSLAEAVSTEEVNDPARHNLVIEELSRGFTLGGRALRAARVRVGRHRSAGESSEGSPDPEPASDESAADAAPLTVPER